MTKTKFSNKTIKSTNAYGKKFTYSEPNRKCAHGKKTLIIKNIESGVETVLDGRTLNVIKKLTN